MGNAPIRCSLGLQKFTKVSHRVFTFFLSLWDRSNEPSRSDDSIFKSYVDAREGKKKGVFAIERYENLKGLNERREEAQERNRRYRQRMTEAYGRMTKERIFVEGQLMLKVADYVR